MCFCCDTVILKTTIAALAVLSFVGTQRPAQSSHQTHPAIKETEPLKTTCPG